MYLRNLIAGATGASATGAATSDLSQAAQHPVGDHVLIVLPIVLVTPSSSGTFVSGVTLGSVKG